MSVGLLVRVLPSAENSSLLTLAFAEGWGYSQKLAKKVYVTCTGYGMVCDIIFALVGIV